MEDDGRVFMHVVHQEDAGAEAGEKFFHPLAIKTAILRCGGTFEAVKYTCLVAFGL